MAILKREYFYVVNRGDTLLIIAEKHGMKPTDARELIWEHQQNKDLHKKIKLDNHADKKREVIIDNEYLEYNHSSHKTKGKIVLHAGEKIWIPSEPEENSTDSDKTIIKKELNQNELKGGMQVLPNSKYEVIVPSLHIRIDMEENEFDDDDKFTLYSTDAEIGYRKTLTIGSDKIENDGVIDLEFIATPRDCNYTLEIEIKDEDGNSENIVLFEDRPYWY